MGFLDDLFNAGGTLASGIGSNQAANRTAGNEYQRYLYPAMANIFGTQTGAQTNLYNTQANQQTSQYGTQQQALLNALLGSSNEAQQNAAIDLNRRKFALDAPGTRARQATQGSILQNLQPYSTSGGSARLQAHTPTVSGGPLNALGSGAREAGRLLESGALEGLRKGDTFDPLPKTDFQGGVLKPPGILAPPTAITPPTFPAYQGPSSMESIMGLLGALLSAKGGRSGASTGGTAADGGNLLGSLINALRHRGGGIQGTGEGQPGGGDMGEWQGPIDSDTGGRFYVTDPDFVDLGQGQDWGNFGGGNTRGGGDAPGGVNWDEFNFEW